MKCRLAILLITLPALAQEDGLRDIIGPIEPEPAPPYGWIAAGVVALALLAVGLWLLLRKKPTPPTSLEVALNAIAQARLDSQTLDDAGYCSAVTHALRGYLEGELNIPAPRLTTREFLDRAQGHAALSQEAVQRVQRVLELADLAKFAQAQFGENERAEMADEAAAFLRETDHRLHPPESSEEATA